MRTHRFATVAAASLVAIASAQEGVRNPPLCVFSQSFASSPQSAGEDICKQQLGGATHSWNQAEVTDIGTESKLPQDAHKLRVKFRSGYWVVTAVAPKDHKLRIGEDVEVKQDGRVLSVRRRSDTLRLEITCVQHIVLVE